MERVAGRVCCGYGKLRATLPIWNGRNAPRMRRGKANMVAVRFGGDR
jgi:hypothetical protein